MKRLLAAWMAMLCFAAAVAHAENYVERQRTRFPIPEHYTLVNDYENALSPVQQAALEKRLQDLEKHNGTQIVFLSVPNTGKEGVWVYGQEVLKKWDIGNNGEGNGILFVVGNDGCAILTGPGIGGAVPDILVARLYREVLEPAARRNELAQGIMQVLDTLIKASGGETTMPTGYDYAHPREEALWSRIAASEERPWIILLSMGGVLYAAFLLWRRLRVRRIAQA